VRWVVEGTSFFHGNVDFPTSLVKATAGKLPQRSSGQQFAQFKFKDM